MVRVARVERVVFGNDAADGHSAISFANSGIFAPRQTNYGLYIRDKSCKIKLQHYYIGFRGFTQAAKYGTREFCK